MKSDNYFSDELTIIRQYGVKNQLKKLSEEVYELIEAVLIHECGAGYTDQKARENIVSEIADCTVLIEQLRQYYEISPEEVRKEYDYKISRQLARMINERKEQ